MGQVERANQGWYHRWDFETMNPQIQYWLFNLVLETGLCGTPACCGVLWTLLCISEFELRGLEINFLVSLSIRKFELQFTSEVVYLYRTVASVICQVLNVLNVYFITLRSLFIITGRLGFFNLFELPIFMIRSCRIALYIVNVT